MATTTALLTVEDIERMGSRGEELELIHGVVRERGEMGGLHGESTIAIAAELHFFVRDRGLGRVYSSDTQFVLVRNPDAIVKPDAAFVRADRVPTRPVRRGIYRIPPDLVVEVISPTDRLVDVMEKIDLYLAVGVLLVWLVDTDRETVTVFAPGAERRVLSKNDTLDGGDVLPGFSLPVAQIFR